MSDTLECPICHHRTPRHTLESRHREACRHWGDPNTALLRVRVLDVTEPGPRVYTGDELLAALKPCPKCSRPMEGHTTGSDACRQAASRARRRLTVTEEA